MRVQIVLFVLLALFAQQPFRFLSLVLRLALRSQLGLSLLMTVFVCLVFLELQEFVRFVKVGNIVSQMSPLVQFAELDIIVLWDPLMKLAALSGPFVQMMGCLLLCPVLLVHIVIGVE